MKDDCKIYDKNGRIRSGQHKRSRQIPEVTLSEQSMAKLDRNVVLQTAISSRKSSIDAVSPLIGKAISV